MRKISKLFELDEDDSTEDASDVMYVYLFEADGNYKIGRTSNVERRLLSLHTDCPHPVSEIFNAKSSDARMLERSLHVKFRHKRTHGEWFRLDTNEVNECIKYMAERSEGIWKREASEPKIRQPAKGGKPRVHTVRRGDKTYKYLVTDIYDKQTKRSKMKIIRKIGDDEDT